MTEKQKILHIITDLNTGGAEMMLYKLLSAIDNARFDNTVISLTDDNVIGEKIEALLGVPVTYLGMKHGRPDARRFFRMVQEIRRLRPDVVQTWMYHADLLGGIAAKLAGIKHVMWNIRHSDLPREHIKRSTRWTATLCAWLSHWLPDKIVCNAQRSAQLHAQLGYRKDIFEVIGNGFDLQHFKPDAQAKEHLCRELQIDPQHTFTSPFEKGGSRGILFPSPFNKGGPRGIYLNKSPLAPLFQREELNAYDPQALLVGLIARFDAQKNHAGFIQAAQILARQFPDVHFIMAGRNVNADNAELAQWIAATDCASRLHLLGERHDIPSLTAALDVAVSCSIFGESFPNTVGEAMACGVPCVVTDLGDAASLLGECGFAVTPGDTEALADAIARLLQMPAEERAILGEKARRRMQEHFSLPVIAKRYETLYQALQ